MIGDELHQGRERDGVALGLLQLPRLSDRLHLAADEALELVADDSMLVHLEQRRGGSAPRGLIRPMAPDRLLAGRRGRENRLARRGRGALARDRRRGWP